MSDPERLLSTRDSTLARVINSQPLRWPSDPIEDPIWGLLRMVMAQQVSTSFACELARRAKSLHPQLGSRSDAHATKSQLLRAIGLSKKRADCCAEIMQRSDEILARISQGQSWGEALAGIKGIGPWTISVFRIMVLRDPDVLPMGDVGLERAIKNVYRTAGDVESLGEKWRPFRSVACWYLWRTLGNEQLG